MLPLAENIPPGGPGSRRDQVAELNTRFRHHSATDVMIHAVTDLGPVAMVSSFGAESVVLLHMLAVSKPDTPVLFIDTRMLFTETLVYQQELTERLGLTDVRHVRARHLELAARDRAGTLHQRDTDACCTLRKVEPLQNALNGFDAWITGRKRFQGGSRTALTFFEADPDADRIKVNPLAHWGPEDIVAYMDDNRLPRHPLVAQGYPSIGCAPCTSPVAAGEDPRAGRWRNEDKSECGIHFENGKIIRTPVKTDPVRKGEHV